MKHNVIIIPGLSDSTGPLKFITKHWGKFNLKTIIHPFGWTGNKNEFQNRLKNLINLIDSFDGEVSLIGTSAGASAVFNAYYEREDKVKKLINICGRIREGNSATPTLEKAAGDKLIFKKSVIECEKGLLTTETEKILTVIPKKDSIVPIETMKLKDATIYQLPFPAIQHNLNISLALTLCKKRIINFLVS
tara:strand:+ start:1600 stop:2172 length:573 start_codon:yes stop_codon:yes gene_type:complete